MWWLLPVGGQRSLSALTMAVICRIHGRARWFTDQFFSHPRRRFGGLAAPHGRGPMTVVVVGQTPLINIIILNKIYLGLG